MTAGPTVAMVLAAGRGRRMRPLSDGIPKPALPLPDGPVVGWPLRLAAAAGIQRVVVNTWHLADQMEAALRKLRQPGSELAISREPRLMGTAGGLAMARDRGLLGNQGTVLVLNGDGVLNVSLENLLRRHAAGDRLVTLGLLPHLDPNRWSRVTVDGEGVVQDFLPPGPPGAGEVPLLYPGVMVVARSALDALPSRPGEIAEDLWRPAREQGRLGGVVVSGHWREVGTPSDYLATVIDQLDGRASVHPSAEVAGDAALGCALVGEGARIGGATVVGDSVVSEGAVVRRGARVIRSVLLGAVEAADHEVVVDEFRAASAP
jgi:NDP-sugar pyrophosphorylase family protein